MKERVKNGMENMNKMMKGINEKRVNRYKKMVN